MLLKPLLWFGCIVSLTRVHGSDAVNSRKRVLFVTNSERGLGNVLLATAHSMLTDHPEVDVHFASFYHLEKATREISKSALQRSSQARPIKYENISGIAYGDVLRRDGWDMDRTMNEPGIRGFSKFTENLEQFLCPWSGPEYVQIYNDLVDKINRIDPDVIALDTMLAPALDATRDLNRKHVMISANQLKDHFAQNQPYGAMFWKIPAMNSAYTYPVPWYLIPANIYLSFRLIISAIWTPSLAEKRAYIKKQGLSNPVNILTAFRHDVPWISPSVPETEFPLIVPDNVVCVGPVYLDQGNVKERDPELASWLDRRPTVFLNLGSTVDYGESDSIQMVGALKRVLDQTDVQVLWKFNKRYPFSDDFLKPVANYIESGRFRLETWIKADIAAVLRSGNIALFVHHGGANSFYESLATGNPTVVLPVWVDLYDYAIRTEWLGVGIWGSKKTAPAWTADELESTFMRVLTDSEESAKLKARAKKIGEITRQYGGRKMAANVIVDYMNKDDMKVVKSQSQTQVDREL